MEVITENPIIYIGANDTYDAEIFLALDGKSTYSELRAFQEWANGMYDTKLDPDGKWGKKTEQAWVKYGKEYDEEMGGGSRINKKFEAPKVDPVNIRAKEPSATEKENAKKKGLTWDSVNKVYVKAQELGIIDALLGKLGITPRTTTPPVGVDAPLDPSGSQGGEGKGMSTTTKVLIGVGVLAVVGVILYSVSSSKKAK
jgi:hypothetical protein